MENNFIENIKTLLDNYYDFFFWLGVVSSIIFLISLLSITIFIGLMLSNYPGKYKIEKKIIAIPRIFKTINWLRKKSDEPPLNL